MEFDLVSGSGRIFERRLSFLRTFNGWVWSAEKLYISSNNNNNKSSTTSLMELLNSEDLQAENVLNLLKKMRRKRKSTNDNCNDSRTLKRIKSVSSSSQASFSIKAEIIPEFVDVKYEPVEPDDDDDDFYDNFEYKEVMKSEKQWEIPKCLVLNEIYYIAHWSKDYFIPAVHQGFDHETNKFVFSELRAGGNLRSVPATRIGFTQAPSAVLPVGRRVLARTQTIKETGEVSYSLRIKLGIIAEIPNEQNENRYLVFFDSGGHWLYVQPANLRPVFDSPTEPWRDLPAQYENEICEVLQNIDKDFVQVERGQHIWARINGCMYRCFVLAVDASLVLVHVSVLSRIEWVFRDSSRVFPTFCPELF